MTRREVVAASAALPSASERTIPAVPTHLGAAGRAAWRSTMRGAPLLEVELDLPAVQRFAELVDERVTVREELKRGVLLEEPIVSPTGRIVGTRIVPNPAVSMLRALDRQLADLSRDLGLVPAARVKLGFSLTAAQLQAAEVEAILAGKYRRQNA